jgi:membrane associated rhomboid family serine protease
MTALTLHADAGHLSANLVFGVVFGLLAASALGGGVAWTGILLAGALGNTLNALVQSPDHASIGASTAVFAALGIIVAHALRYWRVLGGGWLRRWSPMVGGVLLLAYTGTGGERTDVVAHLTGFIAGLLLGWAGSRVPLRYLERRSTQTIAAAAGLGLLLGSWAVALVAAG